ncbi:MAG TPA: glycosyltransferase family 2 protein [Burkholderiaceae bacterium]|nr:glycosyltransferase family 2 protein [Burkholderiaceae bacterium]
MPIDDSQPPQRTPPARPSDAGPRISAYVITYNEADKIEAAVRSLAWADEIVVADSHSTDATAAIARGLGARVIQVPFDGFGRLRNQVLAQLDGDWIFSLDADERCTAAAAEEIRRTIRDSPAHDAYLVPRRNYVFGRWIRHSGYYPDYRQPQLFRRGRLRYTEDAVHETYVLEGSLGRLQEAIAQVPFRDLAQVLHKMQRYSTLGVERLEQQRVAPAMAGALLHGMAAFLRHYVVKLGFLDGWAGFVIAFANFEGTFYRYAKHYEKQQGLVREPELPRSFRE